MPISRIFGCILFSAECNADLLWNILLHGPMFPFGKMHTMHHKVSKTSLLWQRVFLINAKVAIDLFAPSQKKQQFHGASHWFGKVFIHHQHYLQITIIVSHPMKREVLWLRSWCWWCILLQSMIMEMIVMEMILLLTLWEGRSCGCCPSWQGRHQQPEYCEDVVPESICQYWEKY